MRYVVALGVVVAFGASALGFMAMKSDIQLIIAIVGLLSGFILLGLYATLGRLNEIADRLRG